MADKTLDIKGVNEPVPLLRTKKILGTMAAGEVLAVEATDPDTVKNFSSFCRQTGHELLESTEENGVFKFLIKRS